VRDGVVAGVSALVTPKGYENLAQAAFASYGAPE